MKATIKKISKKAQEIINGYASNGWNDGICGGKMYNPDFVCQAAIDFDILDQCKLAYIEAFERGLAAGKQRIADGY